MAGGFGDQGAQSDGGDGLGCDASGAGGGDQDGFRGDLGAGAGGGGAAGEVMYRGPVEVAVDQLDGQAPGASWPL